MASTGWDYFATQLHGDGTETLITPNLLLSDVSITKTLSGVDELNAKIDVERQQYRSSVDWTIFVPWQTAIYARLDGVVRAGGIVKDVSADGPSLDVSCVGFKGYLAGMPQTGGKTYIRKSPWTIAKDLWAMLQGEPRSDLGVSVVTHGSNPVLLGQYPGVRSLREGTKLSGNLLTGMNFTWAWKTPKSHPEAPGPYYGVATREFVPYTSGRFSVVYNNSSKALSVPKASTLPAGYTVVGTVDKTYPAPTSDDGQGSPAPYSLNDYDTPDLQEKWNTLHKLGQFDSTETHSVVNDGLPLNQADVLTTVSLPDGTGPDLRYMQGWGVDQTTGEYFIAQYIPVGDGPQDMRVNRVGPDGATHDSMLLKGGGHGNSLGVEHDNGKTYVWTMWGAATSSNPPDLVRVAYTPGAVQRSAAQVETVTDFERALGGGRTIYFTIDQRSNLIGIHTSSSKAKKEWTHLRRLSDYKAGKNSLLSQIAPYPRDTPNLGAMQGLAVTASRLYQVRGGAGSTDTWPMIYEYTWNSSEPPVTRDVRDELVRGGFVRGGGVECEGACILYNDSGAAQLGFGLQATTGSGDTRKLYSAILTLPASQTIREASPLKHVVDLTWPSAGTRRSDLRFVVGENVMAMPVVEMDGDDYADEVLVQGSGEGSAMIRQKWSQSSRRRLRRVRVITDDTIRSNKDAAALAEAEGKKYAGDQNVTQLVVANHPNAPLGSWDLGDVIPFRGNGAGWAGDIVMDVRVLSYNIQPDTNDYATVTVARKDKAYNSGN